MKTSMMLRGFAAVCLALTLAAQAQVNKIQVTTRADENGENPSGCSLREAVTAAYTHKAYGGCPAGDDIYDNVIQLPDQLLPYQLDREITVLGELVIAGAETLREKQVNPMTGQKPRRVRPTIPDNLAGVKGSEIRAAPGRRIFNVEGELTINNLVLTGNGAVSQNGGLIYSAGSLSVSNSLLRNGRVSGVVTALDEGYGGAIYLARSGSNVSLTDVTLSGNIATNKGGAIAMSCRVDLISFAAHQVSITRSLLQGNSSATGAGAVEFCGDTSGSLTASTLSGNVSAAGSGALTFVQPSAEIGVGGLNLNYVTAAEQQGHVLALSGLAGVDIQGSLLGFTTGGAFLCHFPNPTNIADKPPTSTFNVFSDNSCSPLFGAAGQNTVLATGTPLSDLLHPLTANASYALTDFYLPLENNPYLVDAGNNLDSCKSQDQRNTVRQSGALCDIGSVERLQLTANDDEGENRVKTNREAAIDVLINDTFGENASGPLGFRDNETAGNEAVQVISELNGTCEWRLNTADKFPGKLVVTSVNGALTDEDHPVICQYVAVAADGTLSAPATVEVQIRNVFPAARKDRYVRPEGSTSITFDPLENDDDNGDGIYGHVDDNPANPPGWEKFFPIEIVTPPELGTVVGTGPTPSGLCPGSASEPKTCLAPPLRYIPNNNLSPFADKFTYRAYDDDGAASSLASVTIATDAPEAGHGGGSVDLLGGAVLALLGLRRLRRL
jgi:CSLREA domain-containing protein